MRAEPMLGHDYRVWVEADLSEDAFHAARLRVAILALRQASLSGLAATFEDLQAVNHLPVGDRGAVAARVVATETTPRRTLSGLTVIPHLPLDDRRYHAVILPALYDDGCLSDAGYGPLLTDGERRWLKARHAEGAVIATMCSGAYALAEAGLLDGGATAMHWLYAPIFRQRFPRVETMTRRSLVVSGAKREIITGGAAVYASDVSLCLIARFFGPERALLLAKLYGKASGESLLEEARAGASALETDPEDRVVALAKRFILSHLASPGLVGAAAELAHLDPQTLARRFHRALGLSPRAFIAAARIDRARDLLARTRLPIEEVAARVGYRDRSAFAKAFRARSGLPPAEYRRRFASPARLTEFAAE